MQKLTVYPNPFTALGPDGMPCGRVLVEPGHPRPMNVLGGKLVKKRLERAEDMSRPQKERAAAKRLDVRDARVVGVANIRMRPLALTSQQYFKERVASGDLIAADKATYAALFGRSAKDFVEPFDFLKTEMRARIREWRAINGEPPALASYRLVQNGDEIALAAKDAAPTH
jgi:predicted xylose isomerase-like sugar epimerase